MVAVSVTWLETVQNVNGEHAQKLVVVVGTK